MKIEKLIQVNLNDQKAIIEAINYNRENDFSYIIGDTFSNVGTPLIPWDNICLLLRNDYKIDFYKEKQPTFIHKHYKEEIIEEKREK